MSRMGAVDMKIILLLLLATLACHLSLAAAARVDIPGFSQTSEGNEFFVGFFRNRFGRTDEQEAIPPVLWITTREDRRVRVEVFTAEGRTNRVFANPGEITYVNIPIGFVVFDSSENSDSDSQLKGIRIKAQGNRKIVVFGQNEEVASNDAYLALPIISRPAGSSYEYIAASILGDPGTAAQDKDSVALIIGTEDDTEIILEPSVIISHPFAPTQTGGRFIAGAPVQFRTVTIQRFQTFYLQVRGADIRSGDISGTRIIANKPISVFSGHECADVPITSEPCDMVIEQIAPIDTWGTEVVTIPLRTRDADIIKVFASLDSTAVNVASTDISSGIVTSNSFTLNRNGFMELTIDDFSLIQSNNPIGVYQFSRSYRTDNNINSDPFMLSVPPCEQYRDSYAIVAAPFDPSIEGSVTGRVAYVNYTNIAVPAEYFDASMITINDNPINASDFSVIRRADSSIWGYGAQLLLDEGVQVIEHQDSNAALAVTLYGFSNQQSWGCTGGTALAPVTIARIQCSDVTVFESAGIANVPCVRSGPLGTRVSFNISTVDGSATAGNDYTAIIQREITFEPGQSSINITIPITVDDSPEPEETFTISIDPNPGIIPPADDPVVTVIDTAEITVQFTAPLYSTLESTEALQAALISSAPINLDYQVRVRFSERSATRNVDFSGSAIFIIIPAGETRVNFTVPVTADNIFEGTEAFLMRLDIRQPPKGFTVVTGSQSTATGQIIDEGTVRFSQTTYNVNENAGPAQPTLVLSDPPDTDITVEVTSTDGSATGGGVDYTSGPYTVTFLAGNTTATFDVPINDDNILEGTENFILTIDDTSLASGLTVGDPGQATVNIADVVPLTVSFGQTTYSVDEDAGPAQPMLVLSGTSTTAITVQVTSGGGSATGGGVDYTSGPYTVTFPAGQTTATFDVPINDDDILEGNENFILTINPSSLPSDVSVGDPDQATVTIVDNDPITVTFNQTTYSVDEDAGPAQPGLVLSNPSSTDITVEVATGGGSATGGGVDYTSGPYTVIFPAGQTTATFDVPINDDNILEGSEDFILTIDQTSLPSNVTRGNPGEATVTIVDDDLLTVTFSQNSYSGNETSGVVPVTLLLEGGTSSSAISVTVTPSDQSPVSAQGNGVDYTSTPIIATFAAGSTSTTINVPVTVDSIAEPVETFDLSFTIPSSLSGQVGQGRITDAVGAILDATTTTVRFGQTTYSVDEDDGPAQPTLVLSGPSATAITVQVTSGGGSATGGGVDYTSGPYTVTFLPGQTTATFDVPIIDDNILEGNENFILTIDSSSLPSDVTVGSPGQATVNIVDDDPITVTFNQTAYSVDEDDGPAQPTLVLSNPSATDITVEVTTGGGSATGGGVDYTSGPYTVTFPAGQTTATFDVPINDDNILEDNENFILTIDPSSLPSNVTIGDPGQATVTIVDDSNDDITVTFSRTTYSVDEDDGPAQPTLVLSNPSSTPITVQVRDDDNTATGGGVDYTSGPYTVTFAAGQTTATFDVPINDDSILENDEDFRLIIVAGSLRDRVTRANPFRATVTIADNDDVTVRFASSTGTVSEGNGTVTITIEKVGNAAIPVMVAVTTSDGTATASSDYGIDGDPNPPVFTSITIPAGVSSVDIQVPIIDDNCRENDETFNGDLTVLPNQNVNLGNPDRTVITIVDNDVSTVEFLNAPYTVVEGSGMAYNVCLSITPVCDLRAEVELVTAPKDALPNADYDPVTVTVSFAPNQMISCVQIDNIIDDNIRETTQCFSLIIQTPPDSKLVPGGNANVTILDDDATIATTTMFNDTVIGDPLYEVPLNEISTDTFPEVTSLCYEIHGEAGQVFNLVSDGCVQVNANYSAMDIPANGNIISQIGVFAYDTAGGCVSILVDVSDCIPVVNGVAYSGDPGYNMNGVTARRRNGRARISVPNCANEAFDNLVFWVTCQDIEGQKMIKFQVVRGDQLIPDSHGLLGQFWNIPVTVSNYTGEPLTLDSRVTPYVVTVDHPDDPARQFVAELFQRTWDKSMKPCLYAGDGQGGSILDPVTPNDPVIAGTFRDYKVSDIFSSDFIYNKLQRRNCP